MKATTFKLTILEQNLIAAQKEGGEQEVNEKLALSVKQVQVMIQNLNSIAQWSLLST